MREVKPWEALVRRGLLSAQCDESLSLIRARADVVTKPALLVHFTDHSIRHLDRVATNFLRLAEHNLVHPDAQLSQDELFVGLASCYLHDAALQATTGRRIPKAVDELAAADYVLVRNTHGKAVAEWIRQQIQLEQNQQQTATPELGIGQSELGRRLGSFVARLCQHHQGTHPDPPLQDQPHGTGVLRMNVLLHLLRLADALDLDSSRVSLEQLHRFSISIESQQHWWRHHYTDAVTIDSTGRIEITLRFPRTMPPNQLDYFKTGVGDYIAREVLPAQGVLRSAEIFPSLEPIRVSDEYAEGKALPTDELRRFIESRVSPTVQAPGLPIVRGSAGAPVGRDWPREIWGVQGYPWTEFALVRSDIEYVETLDLRNKHDQVHRLLMGDRGHIRILFGGRGAGKTSFLKNVKELEGKGHKIVDLDAGRIMSPIQTHEQLYNWVFRNILEQLSGDEKADFDFGPENFRHQLRRPGAKPIVVLDNLDRYHEKANLEVVRRFFQVAQGNLDAIRQRALIFISAKDEWESMLSAVDLNYLGPANFWRLAPFAADDIKELINRRLQVCGSNYSRVFSDDAYLLIGQISSGNPRQAILTCQYLYDRAEAEKISTIDAAFIRDHYGTDLQHKLHGAIHELSRADKKIERALVGLFTFQMLSDQSPAPDIAWNFFVRMVTQGALSHAEVPSGLQPAFARIASLVSGMPDKLEVKYWEPTKELSHLLKGLASRGFSASDFASFYQAKPFLPPAIDRDKIVESLLPALSDGQVQRELDLARQGLGRLSTPLSKEGTVLISRHVVEYLLLAWIMKHGGEIPGRYIHHEFGEFTNATGLRRQKFAGHQLRDFQSLFNEFQRLRSHVKPPFWLKTYSELKLIKTKSEAVLREQIKHDRSGKPYNSPIRTRDATLAKNGAANVYDELVSNLRNIPNSLEATASSHASP